MQIHIATLSTVGSVLEFNEIVPINRYPNLDHGGENPSPVKLEGSVIKTESGCLVSGNIAMSLTLTCTRCLTPFEYRLETNFSEEFVNILATDDSAEKDGYLVDELPTYVGDRLDLTELITESIMLAMPMKVICKKDCKGICSECGQLLNEKICQCDQEKPDPRLAVLADLLKNE
ncbi:MAG: DUF177 domain-containing protein [Firmicutes bacterium]|nr:DUF177 domain-containing protein [Bacillota bacterium]